MLWLKLTINWLWSLPGQYQNRFRKIKKAMDAKKVELASEYEFQEQFPG
ncbi:hypothetical protein [Candidatus Coxiella mudrowiae]|nr:hypothetical protein [Candidatus Coxiella mudrowiae]